MFSSWRNFVFAVLAGVSLAVGSMFPGTFVSLLLGLVFCALLAELSRDRVVSTRAYFIAGVSFHIVAFYWLPYTLRNFGSLSVPFSYSLLVIFALLSSLQFALVALSQKLLRALNSESASWHLPVSWLAMEFIFPRMFPWALVHTTLGFKSFAGLSEFVGIYPLSALMLWFVTSLRRSCHEKTVPWATIFFSVLLLSLGWNSNREAEKRMAGADKVRLGIVQGNLEERRQGGVLQVEASLARYVQLSDRLDQNKVDAIVWPESVQTAWLPEHLSRLQGTRVDPYPGAKLPLFYGGLVARVEADPQSPNGVRVSAKFNSVIVRTVEGMVADYYHKQILMPFGEYIPFESTFPWLRQVSPASGDLDQGDVRRPINLPLKDQRSIKVGALVCYEDLVPRLSREFASAGAEILINVTNDVWYGDTAAPHQHNLLASWRALETRRTLVRATNTGVTAVISPTGETLAQLDTFVEDVLEVEVPMLKKQTLYASWGDLPTRILLLITGLYSLLLWFRRLVISGG